MKSFAYIMLVVGALIATTQPLLAAAATRSSDTVWAFEVLLDGKPIGEHRFALSESKDGDLLVRSEAEFDVKFLFVNVLRYRHQSIELWRDGCLQEIDSTTKANDRQFLVQGDSGEGSFKLREPVIGVSQDTKCLQTFAYWNPKILDATALLNNQTGALEPVVIRALGAEELDVEGQVFTASQYAIETGKGEILVWYASDSGQWLALEAPAKGGRTLRYEVKSLPRSLAFLNTKGVADAS